METVKSSFAKLLGMFPAILAAIQAVKGAKDKKDQERQQLLMQAQQGQAFQQPQHAGVGQIANVVGGFMGGQKPGEQPNAMGSVDSALGSYDSYMNHKNQDEDDQFGGMA